MGLLKEHVRDLLLKLYGEDKKEIDRREKRLRERVEERRVARMEAGLPAEPVGVRHKAEDYEDWMNLNE